MPLFRTELEYLGQIIYVEGIKVDLRKIKTVNNWEHPTNITSI